MVSDLVYPVRRAARGLYARGSREILFSWHDGKQLRTGSQDGEAELCITLLNYPCIFLVISSPAVVFLSEASSKNVSSTFSAFHSPAIGFLYNWGFFFSFLFRHEL